MITNTIIIDKLSNKVSSQEMFDFVKQCLELESEGRNYRTVYDRGITEIVNMRLNDRREEV